MKRIFLIVVFMISSIFVFSQNPEGLEGFVGLKYIGSDTANVVNLFIGNDQLSNTTNQSATDTIIVTLEYLQSFVVGGDTLESDIAVDSLSFDSSTDLLSYYNKNVELGSVSIERIVTAASTTVVDNGGYYGGSNVEAILDEIGQTLLTVIYTETDPAYLASQAANITSTDIINLGNLSGINTGDQDILEQSVYSITLPIEGTLSGSVAAAVEGTDYPTGWVLSASGGNLQVNHGLGRYTANTNVFLNSSGSSYRQLRNFDNAYSGILDVDDNNVIIESISTFYTAYKLRVKIIFE